MEEIVSQPVTPKPLIGVQKTAVQKILPYSIAFAFGLALVMLVAIDFAPH
jgi:hypothetical protein